MAEELKSEGAEAMLRRIDERTALMLDAFNRHIEQDRDDFREMRAAISAIPAKAEAAAHGALVTIGFNIDDPVTHQKDMALLHEVRDLAEKGNFFEPLRAAKTWAETQDTVKKAGLRVVAGTLVASLIGLVWLGLADKIKAMFG